MRHIGHLVTTQSPTDPPPLSCLGCETALVYVRSYVDATVHEQWDYFVCPDRCGTFEYDGRSRHLQPV